MSQPRVQYRPYRVIAAGFDWHPRVLYTDPASVRYDLSVRRSDTQDEDRYDEETRGVGGWVVISVMVPRVSEESDLL